MFKYTHCGDLNKMRPHRLIGRDTIRRCVLVGRSVSLGEDF